MSLHTLSDVTVVLGMRQSIDVLNLPMHLTKDTVRSLSGGREMVYRHISGRLVVYFALHCFAFPTPLFFSSLIFYENILNQNDTTTIS